MDIKMALTDTAVSPTLSSRKRTSSSVRELLSATPRYEKRITRNPLAEQNWALAE
jgi:hypothetical protein